MEKNVPKVSQNMSIGTKKFHDERLLSPSFVAP